jgi:hypothetical protein
MGQMPVMQVGAFVRVQGLIDAAAVFDLGADQPGTVAGLLAGAELAFPAVAACGDRQWGSHIE